MTNPEFAAPALPTLTWQFAHPGRIKIGSERHKQLFCHMLLDTFDPYRPAVINWPELPADALARVTSLPFWAMAIETEEAATANIELMARHTSDPLIRRAIDLMAFEERRHREVLSALVARYNIDVGTIRSYVPRHSPVYHFMSTGYGECLDSFFAFGLFELARQSGYFPPELVETFEPVIKEEARHILFFTNWAAYMQKHQPLLTKPWFLGLRIFVILRNVAMRIGMASLVDGDDAAFAKSGRDSVGVNISPRTFIDLCLAENERRLGGLDSRLARPQLVPSLARLARRFAPRQ